jgi:hypothetical protein
MALNCSELETREKDNSHSNIRSNQLAERTQDLFLLQVEFQRSTFVTSDRSFLLRYLCQFFVTIWQFHLT